MDFRIIELWKNIIVLWPQIYIWAHNTQKAHTNFPDFTDGQITFIKADCQAQCSKRSQTSISERLCKMQGAPEIF